LAIAKWQLNLFGLIMISIGLLVGSYFTARDIIPKYLLRRLGLRQTGAEESGHQPPTNTLQDQILMQQQHRGSLQYRREQKSLPIRVLKRI